MKDYKEIFSNDEMKTIITCVTSKDEISPMDLQLLFVWGYNKAGHAIDVLEDLGIISEYQYPKKRKVLKTLNEALSLLS
jgi:hypothetical protein